MVEIAKRAAVESVGTEIPVESDGFRARLAKASLPDLVQLECLAQSESSFRVISDGRVGYLFFQHGQLVHAFVDDLAGEDAALQILGWQRGTFEPCRVERPQSPRIHSGWQQIVMNSARLRDESRRPSLAAVPSMAAADTPPPPQKRVLVPPSKPNASARVAAPPPDAIPPISLTAEATAPPSHEFVRLDAMGNVLSGRGDVETLAQVASYAARLAALIGDALGMSHFTALEAVLEDERKIVHVDHQGGAFVLVASANANLTNVRKKFDL